MTINDLFLLCSNIDEYTEFMVFEDFDTYLFDTAPIAVGTFEDLDPVLCEAKVCHFRFSGKEVHVEVQA